MYTRRTYSIGTLLKWTRYDILSFLILATIPVILYTVFRWYWLHLPWLPIGLVGTAVAFIVGFKNNASYARLWEARKIWGGIVNASRSFAMMTNDFITNEHTDNKLSEAELFGIRKELILRHVAWMSALRHALRAPKPWEITTIRKADQEYMRKFDIRERTYTLEQELDGYVSDKEKAFILSKKNKQAACINLQSKQLRRLKEGGYIWEFSFLEMEKMMVEFYALQGKVERIKNFPYPRQFATLNRYFVWIFIFLLPYGIMHEFDKIGKQIINLTETWKVNGILPEGGYHYLIELIGENFVWFTIPFSIVISWVFHTMERIGDVSENPFEGSSNDVPITTMARGIEIDIRQIIGEDDESIPNPIETKYDTQL
ncbi:MAG: hypothetical protein HRT67_12185 [Flavobacteriaceae bacterium]|nr:hypothetical protein [Flavobacteriaceae bacterium]